MIVFLRYLIISIEKLSINKFKIIQLNHQRRTGVKRQLRRLCTPVFFDNLTVYCLITF